MYLFAVVVFSQEDIEKFRDEMMRRQQEGVETATKDKSAKVEAGPSDTNVSENSTEENTSNNNVAKEESEEAQR